MATTDKRVIKAHYEIARAIALELLAAVGPALHLLVIDVLQLGAVAAAGAVGRARRWAQQAEERAGWIN